MKLNFGKNDEECAEWLRQIRRWSYGWNWLAFLPMIFIFVGFHLGTFVPFILVIIGSLVLGLTVFRN